MTTNEEIETNRLVVNSQRRGKRLSEAARSCPSCGSLVEAEVFEGADDVLVFSHWPCREIWHIPRDLD